MKKIKPTYKEWIQGLLTTLLPEKYDLESSPEYPFMHSRNWLLDWVIPLLKIGIEYDGYVFDPKKKGGHQTPTGMANDMKKRNEAQIRGWIILVCTQKTIDDGTFIDQLERAIKVRRGDIRYE